jgi:hypothetical protein
LSVDLGGAAVLLTVEAERRDVDKSLDQQLAARYDRLDTDFSELRLVEPKKSKADDALVPALGLVFHAASRLSTRAAATRSTPSGAGSSSWAPTSAPTPRSTSSRPATS